MSYDKSYYETDNYENYASREQRYHQLAAEVLQLLKQINLVAPESKILDYGCAFGFLMKGLIEHGQTNVSGFDISKYATSVARQSGLNALDKPDGMYDIVFALDVLEHMTDAQIITMFCNVHAPIIIGRIPVSVDGETFHLDVSRRDKSHINCKTKDQWAQLLSSIGYTNILRLNLYSIYDSDGVFSFLAM